MEEDGFDLIAEASRVVKESGGVGGFAPASDEVVSSLYETLAMLPDTVVRGLRRYLVEHWVDGRPAEGKDASRMFPNVEQVIARELNVHVASTFAQAKLAMTALSAYTSDLAPCYAPEVSEKYCHLLDLIDEFIMDAGTEI